MYSSPIFLSQYGFPISTMNGPIKFLWTEFIWKMDMSPSFYSFELKYLVGKGEKLRLFDCVVEVPLSLGFIKHLIHTGDYVRSPQTSLNGTEGPRQILCVNPQLGAHFVLDQPVGPKEDVAQS